MARWIDEAELIELIRPGATVFVGGSTGEPDGIMQSLEARSDALERIEWIQQPIGTVNKRDLSRLGAGSLQRTFFMTPALVEGLSEGRVRFTPMHMRAIFDHLKAVRIDVALLLGARDRYGEIRLGPCVDYVDAVLGSAEKVVLEVSGAFRAPLGSRSAEDVVDYMFATDTPPPVFPQVEIDETSRAIGANIAEVIRDGDCLQTGIGAVPAAILANLTDKNDLGFHGGLIDDGVMLLARNGNLNGRRKAIDRGDIVTGMALGSEDLLEWVAETENVIFRGADYTHEVRVISRLDNFVSVNSAVQVDLLGQVNGEFVGGRQISGTGGSVDFMRAVKSSRGGRSIVAMSATARGGTTSRIVPRVEMVTALRTDVDMVVTEFGVAEIGDACLEERADRLIAIAHPDYREELRAERRFSGR